MKGLVLAIATIMLIAVSIAPVSAAGDFSGEAKVGIAVMDGAYNIINYGGSAEPYFQANIKYSFDTGVFINTKYEIEDISETKMGQRDKIVIEVGYSF